MQCDHNHKHGSGTMHKHRENRDWAQKELITEWFIIMYCLYRTERHRDDNRMVSRWRKIEREINRKTEKRESIDIKHDWEKINQRKACERHKTKPWTRKSSIFLHMHMCFISEKYIFFLVSLLRLYSFYLVVRYMHGMSFITRAHAQIRKYLTYLLKVLECW